MDLRGKALRVVASSVGLPFAWWRYAMRDVEIRHRSAVSAWPPPEGWRAAPDGATRPGRLPDGYGPVFWRRYRIAVHRPVMTPDQLLAVVAADPNVASPVDLACFAKRRGEPHDLAVGDEYDVLLPGPWNGPVRVVEHTSTSFRLATLRGHLESGELEFRACAHDDGMQLSIDSWARSAGRVRHVLYRWSRVSMAVQLHMWAQFLERAARISGGAPGGVDVDTCRFDLPSRRSPGLPLRPGDAA